MPAVPIKDLDQYEKAIGVLTRLGGTWQGVGQDKWFLLVNEAQLKALLDAQVVNPEDIANGQHRAKKPRKATKP